MSEKTTKKPSSSKNTFWIKFKKPLFYIAFILLNVVVILWTGFSEFGNSENAAKLSEIKIKWWLLIPAILIFAAAMTVDITKYITMLKKTNHKPDWKLAWRTVFIGRYYDNITPAAVGGQPFQIYFMNKSGIKNGYGTVIPIISMVSDQLGFLILAILSFLFGSFAAQNPTIIATGCLGLIFFAFLPLAVLTATFLPKATSELISVCVKALHKMHIIKNREKTIQKVHTSVKQYSDCVKTTLKIRGLFSITILLSFIHRALMATIPFFILRAFGGEIGFIQCFVTTIAIISSINFIPTPGNAGAAEGTFYLVFSGLTSGYIFWAMLSWRMFSYYIFIIVGLFTLAKIYIEKKRNKSTDNWPKDFTKTLRRNVDES